MRIIENINIVLEDKVVFGDLVIKDGLIEKIINKAPAKKGGFTLLPGFIDLHIHGSSSYDAMDGDEKIIRNLSLSLVKEGTTSYLPTTMTQATTNIKKALKAIGKYYQNQDKNAAKVLGIHLEGPYISINAPGAQPVKYIKNPDLEEFIYFNQLSGNIIKKVSLAPENDENFAFIKYLKNHNIIASIAHTKANYQTALKAIKAGATSLTHTYNAMSPLHHRDIGVVGAGLLHPQLYCEFIFDKIHISIPAAKILLKNKTYKKMILVTDSMRNKFLPEGLSEIGGQKVYIKNNEARLADGTLAGSILKMIDGYKYLIRDLKLPFYKASHIASLNAAKTLGFDQQIGSIKEGKFADLVIIDQDFKIKETIINGNTVFFQS